LGRLTHTENLIVERLLKQGVALEVKKSSRATFFFVFFDARKNKNVGFTVPREGSFTRPKKSLSIKYLNLVEIHVARFDLELLPLQQ